MRAANFADFFGIDVLKIYLISRNVKLFENCKKVQNHSTLLYSVYNIHICIHIRTTVWSEKEESAKRACSVSLLSVVIVITLLHLHFVIKQCQFLFCHDRFWHRTEQNSVSSFSVMKGFWHRTEQNSVSYFSVMKGFWRRTEQNSVSSFSVMTGFGAEQNRTVSVPSLSWQVLAPNRTEQCQFLLCNDRF